MRIFAECVHFSYIVVCLAKYSIVFRESLNAVCANCISALLTVLLNSIQVQTRLLQTRYFLVKIYRFLTDLAEWRFICQAIIFLQSN